jgi:hypothetical protein
MVPKVGLDSNTLFCRFTENFDFLRKTANFVFRTALHKKSESGGGSAKGAK